jgi:hypothetical protein
MIDLTAMSIERIVIHKVPNTLQGIPPTFGDSLFILDLPARIELCKRIVQVMGRGSNCIEMQVEDRTSTSAASIVSGIIACSIDTSFISDTQLLAQKLYNAQSHHKISEGLLVCLQGRTGAQQQQFIALIKAEPESGFTLNAENHFEFLSNLFLTETQRLYKIGFWTRNTINTPIMIDDLGIHIFDQNSIHTGTATMANYFSHNFLGCRPLANAALQTEHFYKTTKDFIVRNNSFSDEQKVCLTNALHTYLTSDQSAVINSQTFATAYFDSPEIIDQYSSRLSQDSIPTTAITKDISKIKNLLRIRRMKFNSGVKITFPSSASEQSMGDLLCVESYNETTDYTSVKIKGRIESQ